MSDAALEQFRTCKLGLERRLASGMRWREQTDEERDLHPTHNRYIEVPLTDDERQDLERKLQIFSNAIKMLERP